MRGRAVGTLCHEASKRIGALDRFLGRFDAFLPPAGGQMVEGVMRKSVRERLRGAADVADEERAFPHQVHDFHRRVVSRYDGLRRLQRSSEG